MKMNLKVAKGLIWTSKQELKLIQYEVDVGDGCSRSASRLSIKAGAAASNWRVMIGA